MRLYTFQKLAFRASTPLLFSTIFISPCKAYADWVYPPSSSSNALAYNYNDVVYFTWDSNFTNPSIALWCATHDEYYALYTANVTTNGTDPQSFPYADSYNQTCHMSLYCHGSPDCGPVGASPEFSLLHNHAAAAQTWGLSATASIGKAAAAAPTATVTSSSTSSLAAAKTAQKSASASVTEAVTTRTATAALQAGSGLSAGAKAGIGVGVAVGAIAVLAALCFCVVRARGRPRRGEMSADALGAPEMMSEQEYTTRPGGVGPSRHEMSGEGRLNELQGTPQAELSSVASPVR